jgi:hypothetical protein
MEPVYNGTIFNSTVKVQLYGFFSVLSSALHEYGGSAPRVCVPENCACARHAADSAQQSLTQCQAAAEAEPLHC